MYTAAATPMVLTPAAYRHLIRPSAQLSPQPTQISIAAHCTFPLGLGEPQSHDLAIGQRPGMLAVAMTSFACRSRAWTSPNGECTRSCRSARQRLPGAARWRWRSDELI